MEYVAIGCGAGFAGDRFDAAVPVIQTLAKRDCPRYLIYEVMGERTLAIAHREMLQQPETGYSTWLHRYLPHVLADCRAANITIVANFGNANPQSAAKQVLAMARQLGLENYRIAVVLGDNVADFITPDTINTASIIEGTRIDGRELIGANAYLGAQPIAQALSHDPDMVLVGRSTDAALVLGPLMHTFNWQADDFDKLARGTVAGHLLECGSQVSGGYFADPGFKDVTQLSRVGFPLCDIASDGSFVITKADNTGGLISKATVIEQLLYEMHDPACYLTPDVTVDITQVQLKQTKENTVEVTGVKGKEPPGTLKTTLSMTGGWLGEAEISYNGSNALARAELASTVLTERLQELSITDSTRIEILGTGSTHAADDGLYYREHLDPDGEYRVRLAIRSDQQDNARIAIDEVLALYCCGPAGGGGVRQHMTRQIVTASVLLPREPVEQQVEVVAFTNDESEV